MPASKINCFALARVLANLMQNAIEAVPAGSGKIDVSLHSNNGRIEFLVRDNGPGIDSGIIDRIFELRVTSKPKGMGFGLYISKKIVEASGGTITARNLKSGGAEFAINLEEFRT